MNATADTLTFRHLLQERRNSVLTALGKVDHIAKAGRIPDDDLAQHSLAEFVSLRLNGIEYLQLKQVEEALDRLQSGEYGICQGCDNPIPAKRLQAVPWATFCVRCQERHADKPWHDPIVFNLEPDEAEA